MMCVKVILLNFDRIGFYPLCFLS